MHRSNTFADTDRTIDGLSQADALGAMLTSHISALATLTFAAPAIGEAATCVAQTLSSGCTLHYAAAGSSGLMALADASELPGTFGVNQSQIRICMAGGVPVNAVMPGDTEDDADEAARAAAAIAPSDTAIVLSASGTTPYALSFAEIARSNGARVIAIANVENSALLALGDIAIALPTAPEVINGSTRLGAGTAQKVALNMISTQAGVLMGHVHDGQMVNLNPDNIKLRKRAADIVARIANVTAQEATAALGDAGYNTKLAVLIARGAPVDTAQALLAQNDGHLRACLQRLDQETT